MFFKKRKKQEAKFVVKNELLENVDFINKFYEELSKFGEIKGLSIHKYKDEKSINSYIIPLYVDITVRNSLSYNQILNNNEEHVWEVILCDDTMLCLFDTLQEEQKAINDLTLYLTNDCTSFGINEENLGIDVRY